MGAIGSAIDLVFKMKAEGADSAVAEINKVPKAVQKADDAVKDVATTSDKGSSSVGKLSDALDSLSPLASSAGTALGVVAAGTVAVVYGFTQIISAASKAGAAIYGATIQTGLSAQTLTTLGFNAQLAGQSIEQVLDPVKEFTRLIGEAANGSTEASEKMTRLGLTPVVALQNLDKALTQTLKKIGEMPTSVEKTNLAMDAFGEQGAVVIRMLDRFGGDLDKARAEAERLGITLSNDAAKGAADFDRALITVQAQLTALTHQFGREFLPTIGAGLQQLSGWLAENKGAVSNWATNISDAFRGVVEAIRFLQGVILATENVFAGFFGSTLNGAVAWASRLILTVFDPIGSAIARIIEGFRQIGAERRKAEGTAEGSAGIERTVFGDASGSATGGIGGGGKVGTGGTGRGGGGGRARLGGGGSTTKPDEVAQQEKVDALLLQAKKSVINELAAQDKKDLADRKISKEAYDALQRANDAEYLAYEYELLAKRAQIASATVAQKAKMAADIKTIESNIRVIQLEADAEATENQREQNEQRQQDALNASEYIAKLRAEREESEEDYPDRIAVKERKVLEQNVKNAEESFRYARTQAEINQATAEHLTALIVLRQFDIARLEKARQIADDKAKAEAAAAVKSLEDYKLTETQKAAAKVEIDKKLNNDLLVNYEQYLAGKQVVEDKAGEAAAVQVTPPDVDDPLDFINEERITPKEFLLNRLEDAFNGVAQAVGNAVSAWVLYGKAGASVRQVAAQIIASIAQMAAIEAVWNLAQGFAKLAMAVFGVPQAGPSAAMHFKAAAIFGVIAIGSAIAGRAVAGNSGGGTQNQSYDFRANTIDSNNSSTTAGNTTQMLSESRTQRQDQRITLEVQSRDSHIVRVVGDDLRSRGDLVPIVVKLVEQN